MGPLLTYSVDDHSDTARFQFPPKQRLYGEEWDLVATDLADDFYHNHDGWECNWRGNTELQIQKSGEPVATFIIEMEMTPRFVAWEKTTAEA